MDNAKHNNVVMPMFNLIEHSDNQSKTSGGIWQYYRDEPFLYSNGAIANGVTDFPADKNNNALFKFKTKIVDRTGNNGTKDIKIIAALKCNCWRTLRILLTNSKKSLILT